MAPRHNNRPSRRGNNNANQQNRQRSGRRTTNNGDRSERSNGRRHSQPNRRYFGCGICQADHRLTACKKFDRMNLAEKYKTAVKLHYCVNCLARNHLIGKCTSKIRCQKCGGKHHSVLHGPQRVLSGITARNPSTPNPVTPPLPAPRISIVETQTTTIRAPSSMVKTLVPTAKIRVTSDKKKPYARALLNPSLTTSRIAVSFVRENDLQLFKIDDKVYSKITIMSNVPSSPQFEACMLVVNDLPKKPYTQAIHESIKEKFCRISLADPEFYANSPVAIEIGGDLYTTILKSNMIQIDGGSLVAQDSALGWLVMGPTSL